MADLVDFLNELAKRVYDLERAQERGNATVVVVGTAVAIGIPTAAAVTNPATPATAATLAEVTMEIPQAETAASDITWDILKTGVSIGSCTIATGDYRGRADIGVGFTAGDQVQVEATTPGSGQTSTTMHLVWHTTRDWWHPPVLTFAQPSGATGFSYIITTPDTEPTSALGSGGQSVVLAIPTGGAGTVTSFHFDGDAPTGSDHVELGLYVNGVFTGDTITLDAGGSSGPQSADVTPTSSSVADADNFQIRVELGASTGQFDNFTARVVVTTAADSGLGTIAQAWEIPF